MKKTLVGSIILACVCALSQAQTTEQLSAYNAAIKSQENFNKLQREAGMPEMDVPSIADWLKSEEDKTTAPTVSAVKKEDPQIRWAKKLEKTRPQLCELKPVKDKSNPVRSQKAIKEKERLLKAADKAYEKQVEIERKLDEIAARHNVKRTRKNGEGKTQVLSGEGNGYPVWLESHNQIAAAGISADELWPTNSAPWPSSSTGRDLTGTNVLLGMWEVGGGVETDHQEFSGRVIQQDIPAQLSDHASGVAGTMAGDGTTISLSGLPTGELARGVAFNAYVDAYTIKEFNSEMADASAGTTNIVGLRTSNHSWGLGSAWDVQYVEYFYYNGDWYADGNYRLCWMNDPALFEDPNCGNYIPGTDGTGCNEIDALMATNAPRHLLVFSSGNNRNYGPGSTPANYFYQYQGNWALVYPGANDKDWASGDGAIGFDTVMAPGTTKNVLTVGSIKDVHYDDGGQLTWGFSSNSTINVSDFSACGPTDDGRIKPDVVAVGESDDSVRSYGIVTPVSSSTTDYKTDYSGTSFSAPSVTGGIGLFQERRTQLFPDLEAETDDLLNSSLKAISIHTADDIYNVGPDYLTGWGLFNAVSAVELVELDAEHGRGTHIKELELSVDETNSWTVVLDGSPFKATIAWSDLPGDATWDEDDSTPMLVNNLDLWVENEAGTQVFEPWVLDPDLTQERESVRDTDATTGYDDINNVEQVFIESPVAGNYKIFVTHAGGTSGGEPTSDQTLSIITSGDTPAQMKIVEFEHSPTNETFLLSLESDPGSYMQLESCTDLVIGAWQTNSTFATVGNTNSMFVSSSSDDIRFWRIRRETGTSE